MIFQPIQFDEAITRKYEALFSDCFPDAGKFNRSYLNWLYRENPQGTAVGFDAWDGDQLAAHYVCIPFQADLGATTVQALLSLNTATHPRYQGRGLFTQLAERTYDLAAQKGYAAVCGVANANSTPGFVRKLGFQLVEPLQARIGVGRPFADRISAGSHIQFRRLWSSADLTWRCSNPNNRVFSRRLDGSIQFFAPAFGRLLPAYAEVFSSDADFSAESDNTFLSLSRLYIGLEPATVTPSPFYVDIPKRLRPSPLNLIYRHLSGQLNTLEKGRISFSFLDFDAY